MAERIFLSLSCLAWLPYGLFCLWRPDFLAGAAGVVATSATANAELRAMYGGLQIAIGALAGLAVARGGLRRTALVTLAFLCSGLGLARLLGALAAADLSAYTGYALLFEIVSASAAIALLRRGEGGP